jgi:hypothetical protein
MIKKCFFFYQSPSRLPRWVHVVQKTRAKISHAWAPLSETKDGEGWKEIDIIICRKQGPLQYTCSHGRKNQKETIRKGKRRTGEKGKHERKRRGEKKQRKKES